MSEKAQTRATFHAPQGSQEQGIFAIRGDLDGSKDAEDYSQIRQFIGLVNGADEFLLPIELVDEIIMFNQLTFVPGAPQFVEGVINLRGKIVPAINLRKMMGLPSVTPTQSTRIIITHYEEMQIGIIVDGITYVIPLGVNQIDLKSLGGRGHGADLICGISKRGDKVNGILDIAKVVVTITGSKLDDGPAAKDH